MFKKLLKDFEREISLFSKEKMYCSITKAIIEPRIATCIYYYHALRHQTKDKVHSISNRVTHSLTKQPIEERSRKGGL